MAQVLVDSQVMRDKANTLEQASNKILELFEEMLTEVNTTASKMQGTTITTEQKQFANMQPNFETFAQDINEYSQFLLAAAEAYEAAEAESTAEAEEQGKIF